jgi:hypothetical protein
MSLSYDITIVKLICYLKRVNQQTQIILFIDRECRIFRNAQTA